MGAFDGASGEEIRKYLLGSEDIGSGAIQAELEKQERARAGRLPAELEKVVTPADQALEKLAEKYGVSDLLTEDLQSNADLIRLAQERAKLQEQTSALTARSVQALARAEVLNGAELEDVVERFGPKVAAAAWEVEYGEDDFTLEEWREEQAEDRRRISALERQLEEQIRATEQAQFEQGLEETVSDALGSLNRGELERLSPYLKETLMGTLSQADSLEAVEAGVQHALRVAREAVRADNEVQFKQAFREGMLGLDHGFGRESHERPEEVARQEFGDPEVALREANLLPPRDRAAEAKRDVMEPTRDELIGVEFDRIEAEHEQPEEDEPFTLGDTSFEESLAGRLEEVD